MACTELVEDAREEARYFGDRLVPDDYREMRSEASERAKRIALDEWSRSRPAVLSHPLLPASLRRRLER